MPISSNNTHITFNNSSTQNTAFLGSIAAANITGTITGSQIAPATITAPNIAPGVIPSGGFSNLFTSTTPGPGSWPAPPTTTKIKVTVVGGGGGSGPFGGFLSGGAGGGTGIKIIPVVGGTSYPYTIGAGGPATGAGGTTSFGSPASVSATGGAAAGYCLANPGGSGSGGDINLFGDGSSNFVIGAIPGQGGEFPTPGSPFSAGTFRAGGSFLSGQRTTFGAGYAYGGGGIGSAPPGAGYTGGAGGIIIEF